MKLIKFYKNIFLNLNSETDRKIFLFYFFSFAGMLLVVAFFIKGILEKDSTYYIFLLLFFLLPLFNLIYFKISKKIILASHVILIITGLFFFILFAFFGEGVSGVLWYFSYIPLAIALLGPRKGTIYCVLLLLISIFLLIIFNDIFKDKYSNDFIFRFVINFALVLFFINLFEYSRTKTYDSYIKVLRETKEKNEELRQLNEEINAQKEEILIQNQSISQAYDILFKNEQKMSAIFDTASEGIGTVDIKGDFTNVNTSFAAIMGYTGNELCKMSYFDILANSNETNKENFRKLVVGEIDNLFVENLYIRKDKTTFWGKLSARCLRNSKGEFVEVVGIITDIDKIKKSEEKTIEAYNDIQILSGIGKEITSKIRIKNIIDTVYSHVSKLLDATVFGIGIYNPDKEQLEFDGTIENGQIIESHYYDLTNKNRLAVICFSDLKEIFINDFENEYKNYIQKREEPVAGKSVESVIYLPLLTSNYIIGVMSVQSYKKNVYSLKHLNLLRNVAVYTAIAIENAYNFLEIEKQKNQVVKHNNKIIKSINYARKIQKAIISKSDFISAFFPEHFIIFKPRDIVSGDFYWFKSIGKYFAFVAGDCTGHGVPGAFMSVLGISILNEVVSAINIKKPAQILFEMRSYVKNTLQQTGQRGEQQDGIDIVFCSLNIETDIMYYAGANLPVYIIEKSKEEKYEENISLLKIYNPDKMPIGVHPRDNHEFTNHEIQLKKGDNFYIFSDGYESQFGGEKKEKLKSKHFQELLVKYCNKTIEEQKTELEEYFNKWKDTNEQTDDVLLIGVKI